MAPTLVFPRLLRVLAALFVEMFRHALQRAQVYADRVSALSGQPCPQVDHTENK